MRVLGRTRRDRGFRGISLVVGAVLAAIVAACGGGDDDGVLATLTATSGNVGIVVEVPEGALPSDVAVSEISVVGLDRDEALAGYEGVDAVWAYRFEPAGLEFELPLRLTVELDGDASGVVARLVSSDGTDELLEPVALAIRESDDRVRATYEIGHFSDFHIVLPRERQDPAVVVLPPQPRASYFVGESFTVRIRVHAGFDDWGSVDRVSERTIRKGYRTLFDEPWTATIRWSSDGSGPPSNEFLESLFEREREADPSPLDPDSTTISVGEANTGTATFDGQTFTCERAGDFLLWVIAVVTTSVEVTTSVDGGPPTVSRGEQEEGARSRLIRGTCLAAGATVDPTPDPTETVATAEPTEEPTPEPTETVATPTPPPVAATLAPGFDPCHINPNEEAIGCLPHYDVTSASSRVRTTPDRRLIYEGTREFGGPIPTNPEYPIEYWLVLEGNGQRMEFLLGALPGEPLTCTRTVNGAPSALGPGEACGELIAPNTLRFAGDITAFAPGGLVRTFSTLEIGADNIARGDYLVSGGEEAWELSVPQ
jgi:hypothetical protein